MASPATTTATSTANEDIPVVMRDARFRAGRSLVTSGNAEEAIGVFANLLEHALQLFPEQAEDHMECAIAYYEYGNALLRSYQNRTAVAEQEEGDDDQEDATGTDNDDRRNALALAAEKRLGSIKSEQSTTEPTQVKSEPETTVSSSSTGTKEEDGKPAAVDPVSSSNVKEEEQQNGDENAEDGDDDLTLALEMMESAWSILDNYINETDSTKSTRKYPEWCVTQLPRFLTGIGDVLSTLQRHADAADAYSRALQLRQEQLPENPSQQTTSQSQNTSSSILQLANKRRIVELYVLIAEEFLACPADEDVVTTETSTLLCRAHDRVEFARGYYDKARDELQDTVLLMGELVAKQNGNATGDLEKEKENVCFASTLVMGVGMQLAEHDEQQAAQGPEPKKFKRE